MRSASLPMYALPEMAAANGAFWSALAALLAADGVGGVPQGLALSTDAVPDAIGADVLFTQTCGYPLGTRYGGQFEWLGVPSYAAPGCGLATHCAFIVVHENAPFTGPAALRGTAFAMNSRHSNSGMNLPRLLFAALAGGGAFFSGVTETGSHAASMAMVAAGRAAAASIDCVTWAFHQAHRPETTGSLRILAETVQSPAIPFVTSSATDGASVAALRRALGRLSSEVRFASVRRGLLIKRITPADPAAYRVIIEYERRAAELGYPRLL